MATAANPDDVANNEATLSSSHCERISKISRGMETGVGRDFIDGILTDRQPMMDIEFTEDVLRISLAM